jgi:hypothetical protein
LMDDECGDVFGSCGLSSAGIVVHGSCVCNSSGGSTSEEIHELLA